MDLWKLYQFENGTQLISYAASLLNDEKIELQRQTYSAEFAEQYKGKRLLPHQFTTFAYALKKLSSDQAKLTTKATVNHPDALKASKVKTSQTCTMQ